MFVSSVRLIFAQIRLSRMAPASAVLREVLDIGSPKVFMLTYYIMKTFQNPIEIASFFFGVLLVCWPILTFFSKKDKLWAARDSALWMVSGRPLTELVDKLLLAEAVQPKALVRPPVAVVWSGVKLLLMMLRVWRWSQGTTQWFLDDWLQASFLELNCSGLNTFWENDIACLRIIQLLSHGSGRANSWKILVQHGSYGSIPLLPSCFFPPVSPFSMVLPSSWLHECKDRDFLHRGSSTTLCEFVHAANIGSDKLPLATSNWNCHGCYGTATICNAMPPCHPRRFL